MNPQVVLVRVIDAKIGRICANVAFSTFAEMQKAAITFIIARSNFTRIGAFSNEIEPTM